MRSSCACHIPPKHVGIGFLYKLQTCESCGLEKMLYFGEDGTATFSDGTEVPIVIHTAGGKQK